MNKENWEFGLTTYVDVVVFLCLFAFLFQGLFYITIPLHEFGHAAIAKVQGAEVHDILWGANTNERILKEYGQPLESIGNPLVKEGQIWGACIITEIPGITHPDWRTAHRMYEVWWVGFIFMLALTTSMVGMASIFAFLGFKFYDKDTVPDKPLEDIGIKERILRGLRDE